MIRRYLLALALAIVACAVPTRTDQTVLPPVVYVQPPPAPIKKAKSKPPVALASFIRRVNPEVEPERAQELAGIIRDAAHDEHVDGLVLAGILAQESNFESGLEVCTRRGCDLGMGQVNWPTWGEKLGLDRERLINDDAYSVRTAARILAIVRRAYSRLDPAWWWTYYHDVRDDRRETYRVLVVARAPHLDRRL